jgi:hypothetical protein
MSTVKRQNLAYQSALKLVGVIHDHYVAVKDWLETGRMPSTLSIINTVFGIPVPSLNTQSSGVRVYLGNYHAAVKALVINIGIIMNNALGDVGFIAAQNTILAQFGNFPMDIEVRRPFRFIYEPTTLVRQAGPFPFNIIPGELINLADMAGGAATFTATNATIVRVLASAAGALPFAVTWMTSGNNVGDTGQAVDIVQGMGFRNGVIDVNTTAKLYMPNWSINGVTGIEAMFSGGTQYIGPTFLAPTFALPASQDEASARYFLLNDFYMPIVAGIETFLTRVDASGFGL